ncbi:hypothetical protein ASPZODRAFT_12235 [Penicilliopsis zonata CBS 506.65]|uniref:Cytochrome c oxidase assembly protein COX20, mitochondrial n=1 Tax=Penicilliopsis zonata CBS 506.65 TaxID=1073090 RepID=A0A1L9SW53_9EURO|nr:hypothetical protein ASPZODRAFT_12235 [Penicilliopsis zonata CBS 506.65]OJJ51409.1 hypothetical protein ASPZODRAFT_12235 [Penicilliopsis zonata CBS 506.65]
MSDETKDTDQLPPSTVAEPSPERPKPKHEFPKSQVGKLWDAFGSPEQPANVLPGARYDSTGRKSEEEKPSIKDALKGLSFGNVTSFYKVPCARESLMLAIGVAFGIGGTRTILGGLRRLESACNWAVGSGLATATTSYYFCQRRRQQELSGMKEAVDLMRDIKLKRQREKDQKKAEEEAAAARLAEEERRRKSWTNLANYKFW